MSEDGSTQIGAPSEGPTDKPSGFVQLTRNPLVRLALLGPTVLTAIANMSNLGAFAEAISRNWRPIMDRIWLWFDQIPMPLPIDGHWLFIAALFAPFILAGIFEYARGRKTTSPLTAALSLFGIFVLINTSGPSGRQSNIEWWIPYASYLVILVALSPTLFFSRVLHGVWRVDRFLLGLWSGLIFFAFMMLAPIPMYNPFWLIVTASIIIGSTFFNPERLRDLGLLAGTVIVFSKFHQALTSWVIA